MFDPRLSQRTSFALCVLVVALTVLFPAAGRQHAAAAVLPGPTAGYAATEPDDTPPHTDTLSGEES